MRISFWASQWLLASCVTLVGCAAGSDNTTTTGANSTGKGSSSSSGSGGGTRRRLRLRLRLERERDQQRDGSSSGSSSGERGTTRAPATMLGRRRRRRVEQQLVVLRQLGGGGTCTGYIRGAAPTSTSASEAGPYQTMTYAANASVRATMAYDVTSAHIVYPVGATPPFASIAIVPGFTAAESSIADWAPFLASWGIVTMTFGTSNPMTGASDTSVLPPVRADCAHRRVDDHQGREHALGEPPHRQARRDAAWRSPAGRWAAAARCSRRTQHPELKAVFAMEPWNPNTTYPMDTVPTLMFAGTSDGLAGPPMPQDQYMSIPATTPKILYEITNGGHYVSTSPTNSTTDMAPDTASTANIARFGLSWLKVYLECDTRFRQFMLVKPSDAAEFDTTVM